MTSTLTVKQREIIKFILKYQNENNKIPTLIEMAKTFGVSITAIQCRIDSLTRKKYLLKENIYKILIN